MTAPRRFFSTHGPGYCCECRSLATGRVNIMFLSSTADKSNDGEVVSVPVCEKHGGKKPRARKVGKS